MQIETPPPFLILELQKQIISFVPTETLDMLALVTKAFYELSRNALYARSLKFVELYKNSTVKEDFAYIVLKNLYNFNNEHWLKLVQNIRDPHKRFSLILSKLPNCPHWEEFAAKAASEIGSKTLKQYSYLQIYEATKNRKYLASAFPAPINSALDFEEILELAKENLKIFKSDALVQKKIDESAEKFIENSNRDWINNTKHLVKIAQISSDPAKILRQASSVNSRFNDNTILNLCAILLTNQILPEDIEKVTKQKLLQCDDWGYELQRSVAKACAKNRLDVARWLIQNASGTDDCYKVRGWVTIFKTSKDVADLNPILTLRHNLGFVDISQALEVVLSDLKYLPLARQVAQLRGDKFDDREVKAFLKIYQLSKDEADLAQAETMCNKLKFKIRAYRRLYEATGQSKYLTFARDHAKDHDGFLELAKFSRNIEDLDSAYAHYPNGNGPTFWYNVFLEKITNVCLDTFKNYSKAWDFIRKTEHQSKKIESVFKLVLATSDIEDFIQAKSFLSQESINKLFCRLTKQMIVHKKFEKVQLLENALEVSPQIPDIHDHGGGFE